MFAFCLELQCRGQISHSNFREKTGYWLSAVLKYVFQLLFLNNENEPSYINDIFAPSLNNYNNGSQMTLDIPLCRTNKGWKKSFLHPRVWNKLIWNAKNSYNDIFFHARFEKKTSFWRITIVIQFIPYFSLRYTLGAIALEPSRGIQMLNKKYFGYS